MENEISPQTKAFYIFHCPLSIFHYSDNSPFTAGLNIYVTGMCAWALTSFHGTVYPAPWEQNTESGVSSARGL